jgi:3-hydroxypropionyl-CoA synthetase (ADP-forming)
MPLSNPLVEVPPNDTYKRYGFQAPAEGLAASSDGAVQLAHKIGFPVVLKIASPDILHKTDIGGVMVNLRTAEEVRQGYDKIMTAARTAKPDARIEGVQVQEMVTGGTEIIIGLLDDPQFGPVIMFGLGGVLTEILQDVSFRVLPIERSDARQMIREIKGYQVLQGYRGQEPVSEDMLIDLLINASRMGMDNAGRLESVDLNPILVWGNQHYVLDAKMIWRKEARPVPTTLAARTQYIANFFKGQAIAVVGASANPGKVGYFVLDSLVNYDFAGRVYPINPGRSEIMGKKCYPTLSAVPDPLDVVVVAVALKMVPELILECSNLGIHNMVIVSGGGKELGGDLVALERQIRETAAARNVRLIGPNCIGVFDGHSRMDTFFQVQERLQRPISGSIAMITQSGTVGCIFLEQATSLGVSKFVSYGNRTDVDEADLLAYLADDPETDLIAMYVEGLENGRKLLGTAKEVTKKKPVVVLKVGRTERGARASMSHTGFFGGSYGVVQGAFRQSGMIPVDSMEELMAVCKALAMQPKAPGNRVSMISNGAGSMVQGIDLLKSYGLEMPELSPETFKTLRECYPAYYIVQNPVDVTGSATSADYEAGITALLRDPNIDIVMPWFVFPDTPLEEDIVQKLGRLTRSYEKPILVGTMGGPYTQRMAKAIEAEGVPVFQSVGDWIAAARGLAFHTMKPSE